ncbi:MAG: FHA domain-containing protein [Planctomycetota bacterium]
MAITVCCPCGNPLDCDQLGLVISLTCPRCQQEIHLEVDVGQDQTGLAVLTVMEGPYWGGEQFVMPVGKDLPIGKAPGNWLSVASDAMSDSHCRLHVSGQGEVSIEDLQSKTGTYIGNQRIARGKLAPLQSFSVGGFRFRLELQMPDGTTMTGLRPPEVRARRKRAQLPALERIKHETTAEKWLISNRVLLARWATAAFAWLIGLYHLFVFGQREGWSWPTAGLLGAAIVVLLAASGRRVALAHPHFKYASLLLLVVLAVGDIAWDLPVPAIAALSLAACLTLLVMRASSAILTILGIALAGLSLILAAVQSVRGLISLLT